MAFCQNCGSQLYNNTKFCPNCGTAVAEAPMPAAAPQGEMSESMQVPAATATAVQEPPTPNYQQPVQQSYPQQPAPQQGSPVYTPTDVQMKKGMAILSYFGPLVLVPIFAAKKDPFARYHANQGLLLFVITIILNILSNVLSRILLEISPILTLVVSAVVGIITLIVCIFSIIGIINAAKGRKKPLPMIGGITLLK